MNIKIAFYFGGHGKTKRDGLNILLQGKGNWYPIETMLKQLGYLNRTFVFGVFDCCRLVERSSDALIQTGGRTSKGYGWFIIYGCLADETVPGVSKLSDSVVQALYEAGQRKDKHIIFPADMIMKCESCTPERVIYMWTDLMIQIHEPSTKITDELNFLKNVAAELPNQASGLRAHAKALNKPEILAGDSTNDASNFVPQIDLQSSAHQDELQKLRQETVNREQEQNKKHREEMEALQRQINEAK